MTYRILLVEDQPEWRDLVLQSLAGTSDLIVTAHASSLSEARDHVRRQAFDCGLIDVGLPDGSGISAVDMLARSQPDAEIAVCTVFEDEDTVLQAIQAGASGYILKHDIATDLVRLVDELRNGGAPISSRVARHILRNVSQSKPTVPETALTPRETEVLKLVAQGMTLRRAADHLGIAESTAKSHVKNLYTKLGVNRLAAAVSEAMRRQIM